MRRTLLRRTPPPSTLEELENQWAAEDEGPLPQEVRAAILATPRLFLENAGLDAGSRAALAEMAPLFVLRALWDWPTNYSETSGHMQAHHLIQRICAYAEPALAAARKEKRGRRPRATAVPTDGELRLRFGPDAPVVSALWPCVQFLVALNDPVLGRDQVGLLLELGALIRLLVAPFFANERMPARDSAKRAQSRAAAGEADTAPTAVEQLRRAMRVRGLVTLAEKRMRPQSEVELFELIRDAAPNLLRHYQPSGRPGDPLARILRTVYNALCSMPVRLEGHAPSAYEGANSTIVEIPPSTFRKRKHLPPSEIIPDIDRGKALQRHRDPQGEWLTEGQCAERLTTIYRVSERPRRVLQRSLPRRVPLARALPHARSCSRRN